MKFKLTLKLVDNGEKKAGKVEFCHSGKVQNLLLIHVVTMIIQFTEKLMEPGTHLAPKFWEELVEMNDE